MFKMTIPTYRSFIENITMILDGKVNEEFIEPLSKELLRVFNTIAVECINDKTDDTETPELVNKYLKSFPDLKVLNECIFEYLCDYVNDIRVKLFYLDEDKRLYFKIKEKYLTKKIIGYDIVIDLDLTTEKIHGKKKVIEEEVLNPSDYVSDNPDFETLNKLFEGKNDQNKYFGF